MLLCFVDNFFVFPSRKLVKCDISVHCFTWKRNNISPKTSRQPKLSSWETFEFLNSDGLHVGLSMGIRTKLRGGMGRASQSGTQAGPLNQAHFHARFTKPGMEPVSRIPQVYMRSTSLRTLPGLISSVIQANYIYFHIKSGIANELWNKTLSKNTSSSWILLRVRREVQLVSPLKFVDLELDNIFPSLLRSWIVNSEIPPRKAATTSYPGSLLGAE